MSDKRNGRRKIVSHKRSDMAAQIESRRLLAEYLRISQWDEAMNRKREWWLFERNNKIKKQGDYHDESL